jgi:tetratricopeptide (TPR) repeat protein
LHIPDNCRSVGRQPESVIMNASTHGKQITKAWGSRVRAGLALGLLAAGLSRSAWAAETPGTDPVAEALQKGLVAEEVQRNLPAAREQYRLAVEPLAKLRAVQGTALFRLAEVERRLGDTNAAVELYRRLLREYPEQGELVPLAQQRIGAGPGMGEGGIVNMVPELLKRYGLTPTGGSSPVVGSPGAGTSGLGSGLGGPGAAMESPDVFLARERLADLTLRLREENQRTRELERNLQEQQARWDFVRQLSGDALLRELVAHEPTLELTTLNAQGSVLERQMAVLASDHGPEHPERARLREQAKVLEAQLARETKGIMDSLAMRREQAVHRLDLQQRRSLDLGRELAKCMEDMKAAQAQRQKEATQAADGELEAGDRHVAITGAVVNPGRVTLPVGRPADLYEVVSSAGGLALQANRHKLRLRRDTTVQVIDFDQAQTNRIELQPGDVVDVPRANF